LTQIVAGTADTPIKVGIRNDGDESFPTTITIATVGVSDGASELRIGADTGTLSPPRGLTATVSAPGAGGAFGSVGTYSAVVTALNVTGETVASLEVQAFVSDVTQKITWGWVAVTGATGYNLYRRAPGSTTYVSPTLIDANTPSVSFVDSGAA